MIVWMWPGTSTEDIESVKACGCHAVIPLSARKPIEQGETLFRLSSCRGWAGIGDGTRTSSAACLTKEPLQCVVSDTLSAMSLSGQIADQPGRAGDAACANRNVGDLGIEPASSGPGRNARLALRSKRSVERA